MLNFLQAEQAQNLIVPDSVQKARFTEAVNKMTDVEFVKDIWSDMLNWLVWTGIKTIISLAIFYVARWLLHKLLKIVVAFMTRREVEVSLHSFIMTAVKVLGYVLIVLIIVSILGFNSSSFLAVLASMGLAIGMALSGTLQNFAGGVMILVLRPYRVGDYISAQGQSGTVKAIGLFSTQLSTPDNRTIYVPNGAISTSIVDNYSHPRTRRIDWKISISYGDDIDVARATILEMLEKDGRILKKPAAPMVALSELGDSAIVILVRVWVANADYWSVYFDINEKIYKELPTKGINFPYPQLDVHIKQN